MTNRTTNCGAFTLVELLVVISIIALLLSILMPALWKVREKGRSIVCLANLKRLSIAHLLYQDDYNFSPPFRLTKATPTSPNFYVNRYGAEQPRWQWFFNEEGIGPVIDPIPWVQNQGDSFGDAQTLIMTNDYFLCPSFNHPGFDPRDIRNGSYGYNYQYLGNSRIVNGAFQNYPVNKMKIRRPSETVLLADGRGNATPHGLHSYTLDPPKIAWSMREQRPSVSRAEKLRPPSMPQRKEGMIKRQMFASSMGMPSKKLFKVLVTCSIPKVQLRPMTPPAQTAFGAVPAGMKLKAIDCLPAGLNP